MLIINMQKIALSLGYVVFVFSKFKPLNLINLLY